MAASQALAQADKLRFCNDEIERVLTMHNISLEDATVIDQMQVGKSSPDVITVLQPAECESG